MALVRDADHFSLDSDRWSKRTLKSSIGGWSQPAINQVRTLQGLLAIIRPLQLQEFQGSLLYEEGDLGSGVSYDVFKCRFPRSQKCVAQKRVKLPPADRAIHQFRERVACVLKDIEVMHHDPLASHRNIINLIGYGWNGDGSIPFLITEWAQFGTMRNFLEEHSLSPREQQRLCRHVATGLLELHLCGIAHGDVKLENVLIVSATGDEPDCVRVDDNFVVVAKLADFGHAVLLNPGSVDNADVSQTYRGTADYNAPEVGEGLKYSTDSRVDFRKCDVWSFGCLCLEALLDGARFQDDDTIKSMSSRSSSSSRTSQRLLTPPSTMSSGRENPPVSKREICDVAVTIARRIASPRCRLDFVQTFKLCLSFCPEKRAADLTYLPLLAPGVYEEVPLPRQQLQEKAEEEQPWSFGTLRPLEAKKLVHVAKNQIVLDTEAQMERNPSSRTAFQIALSHATGYGVPRSMDMFRDYASRSSSMGLYIAEFTLDLLQSTDPDPESEHPMRRRAEYYSQAIIEMFRKKNREADRGAAFALLSQAGLSESLQAALSTSNNENTEAVVQNAVQDLLENKANLGATTHEPGLGEQGRSAAPRTLPLLAAARVGDFDAATKLLDNGAEFAIPGIDKSLPLHWLFMFPTSRQAEISKRLSCKWYLGVTAPSTRPRVVFPEAEYVAVSQKLDEQFPIELFGTPLTFAVAAASYSAVSALLDIGASATYVPKDGDNSSWHRSPLHLAASLHLPDITKLLLESIPVDYQLANHVGQTFLNALSHASPFERECIHGTYAVTALYQTLHVIRVFIGNHPSLITLRLELAIDAAFGNADAQMAQALLYNLPYPDPSRPKDDLESTMSMANPVASAVAAVCTGLYEPSNSLELVKIAIKEHLDVELFNATETPFDAKNPIYLAFESRREDLLQLFKAHGVNISRTDKLGRTAFHFMYPNNMKFFSVKTMVALGFDPNLQDRQGLTPLHQAVQHGTIADVEELLSAAASVHTKDMSGSSPLHSATRRQDLPMVERLLEAGCDPTERNNTGVAAIHLAAMEPQSLPIFLQFRQVPEADRTTTLDNRTSLDIARSRRNELLVRLLVEESIKPRKWDERQVDFVIGQLLRQPGGTVERYGGRTSLSLAAGDGLNQLVAMLVRGDEKSNAQEFNPDNDTHYTPLSWAARNGNHSTVRLLAELDPRRWTNMFGMVDKSGRTPLSWAAGNGHEQTVVELIRQRLSRWPRKASSTPKVDQPCILGQTPLAWAAFNGHEKVVKELMYSPLKSDINFKTSSQRTPLSLAVLKGHEKVVKQLLNSSDCDAEAKDKQGCSALSHAAAGGHENIVALLLNRLGHKVDVWEADREGKTPICWALDLAPFESRFGVVTMLLEHDPLRWDTSFASKNNCKAGHSNPLLEAARRGHDKVFKYLLATRLFHANGTNSMGQTALTIAAAAGQVDIVRNILEDGNISVLARDLKDRTALFCAAEMGHHETVAALLLHSNHTTRMDEHRDKMGRTPLTIAEHRGDGKTWSLISEHLTRHGVRDCSGPPEPAMPLIPKPSKPTHTAPPYFFNFMVVGSSLLTRTQLCYGMETQTTMDNFDSPIFKRNQTVTAKINSTRYTADVFNPSEDEIIDKSIWSELRPVRHIDVILICFDLNVHTSDAILYIKDLEEMRRIYPDAPLVLVGIVQQRQSHRARASLRFMQKKSMKERKETAAKAWVDGYLECDLFAEGQKGVQGLLTEIFLIGESRRDFGPKTSTKMRRSWSHALAGGKIRAGYLTRW